MNLSAIFSGHLPADQRKFLLVFCQYMKGAGYEKVLIPCVGQFAAVRVALEAGFTAKQIRCSDTSLYSNLLGHYFMKSRIPADQLEFMLVHESHRDLYAKLGDDGDRIAFLLLLMKMAQLKEGNYHERTFLVELQTNIAAYLAQFRRKLDEMASTFKGIKYEVRDCREYFDGKYTFSSDEFVIMDPPAFSGSYTKLFNFSKYIEYYADIPEFDPKTELLGLYTLSTTMSTPVLWHSPNGDIGFENEHIIYGTERKEDLSYWVINGLNHLTGFSELYTFKPRGRAPKKVEPYRVLQDFNEITRKSVLAFKELNRDTMLYYQEIFSDHAVAGTGEVYFGVFVDNLLFAVAGFNTLDLRGFHDTGLLLKFIFAKPSAMYKDLKRLALKVFLGKTFRDYVQEVVLVNYGYVQVTQLKVVQIQESQRSRNRLYSGLLPDVDAEKMLDGRYKVTYQGPFTEAPGTDALDLFLRKENRK